MKKVIVAATILKCAVCGVNVEMEPKRYPEPEGNERKQLTTIMTLASQQDPQISIHYCDLDRTWGVLTFAGIKHYRTVEEE